MYCRLIFIILFLIIGLRGVSNPHQLRVSIKNQPDKTIYLAQIKGDNVSPIDSISSEGFTSSEAFTKLYTLQIPSTLPPGMYRLIFGKTLVAEVLNEPPQQLDFIFNKEDIAFETDFNAPFDSLRIIR